MASTVYVELPAQEVPLQRAKGWRLATTALLLLLLTVVLYDINWIAGYVSGILSLLVVIWFGLPNARRIGVFCWLLVVTIALVATGVQMIIASNPAADASTATGKIGTIVYNGMAIQAAISLTVGLTVAVVFIIVPLLVLMWAASIWLLAEHQVKGISRWDAMRYLWTLIFRINSPWIIVEQGEVVEAKHGGILEAIGGPGMVIVRPGNAVVMEQGGEVTQISGPGVIKAKRHERVRQAIPLYSRSHQDDIDVFTSDGIFLTLTFGVSYQIEPLPDTIGRLREELASIKDVDERNRQTRLIRELEVENEEHVIKGDYLVWKKSVRHAVFRVPPGAWEGASFGGPVNQLRDIVATYRFDQLLRPVDWDPQDGVPPRFGENERTIKDIETRILDNFRPAAASFGVKLKGVDIKGIKLSKEVHERLLNWWSAHWDDMAHVRRRDPERWANWLERQLRLVEARTDADVKEIEGTGERRFLIEKAEGKAEAKFLDGRGERRYLLEKAEARREASGVDIDTAIAKARTQRIEAEAEKQVIISRGEGEAEARAQQFKVLLNLLYDLLDRDAMVKIITILSKTLAASEDRRLFISALHDTRSNGGLLPSDITRAKGTSDWVIPSSGEVTNMDTGSNHL